MTVREIAEMIVEIEGNKSEERVDEITETLLILSELIYSQFEENEWIMDQAPDGIDYVLYLAGKKGFLKTKKQRKTKCL